jgi:histone deacetylase 1/2
MGNGLFTGPLRRTSSVSYASPLAHLVFGLISAPIWFPNTGANQHVTPDLATLTNSAPYLGNDHLHVGNNNGVSISHIGHSMLRSPKHTFTYSNILHVPHITKPLLSVQKFCRNNNVYFKFHASVFYVKDLTTKAVLFSGQSNDGLYVLSESSATTIPQAYCSPCISDVIDLWHHRLGHPTSRIFNLLVSKNKIMCTSRRSLVQCQACPLGKSSCLLLRPTGHKTTSPLDLIFSDVWSSVPMFSSDDFHYFVIFIDAHTKYIWYFPLVAKSDVFSIFQHFQVLVERQFSHKIKYVQTDWGGEYCKLYSFFQTIGIHHRLIYPHTHEQNGSVERRYRHIVEIGLTLLGQYSAPL